MGEAGGGVFGFGVLVLVVCLTLDWELVAHETSDCVVDGTDPFRGAWMHLVSSPGTKCTAEDGVTKTNPPAVGAVLQCLLITSAHGDVCVGGQDLAGRKANAWFFLWLGVGLCALGLMLAFLEQACREGPRPDPDVEVQIQMHALDA
jgi:hypothetical protein